MTEKGLAQATKRMTKEAREGVISVGLSEAFNFGVIAEVLVKMQPSDKLWDRFRRAQWDVSWICFRTYVLTDEIAITYTIRKRRLNPVAWSSSLTWG